MMGLAMFATPCATSSMLERCRPPIIPSATTAERSDSMPASSAIVKAGPMSAVIFAREMSGRDGTGTDPEDGPEFLDVPLPKPTVEETEKPAKPSADETDSAAGEGEEGDAE